MADPAIDLIIMGKQAIDGDSGHTGPALGAFLGWPFLGNASKITITRQGDNHAPKGSGTLIKITSDMETGSETNETRLPCLVTVDLRLNEPRYASLPNIMKAKKKNVRVVPMSGLFMDAGTGGVDTTRTAGPSMRAGAGTHRGGNPRQGQEAVRGCQECRGVGGSNLLSFEELNLRASWLATDTTSDKLP